MYNQVVNDDSEYFIEYNCENILNLNWWVIIKMLNS